MTEVEAPYGCVPDDSTSLPLILLASVRHPDGRLRVRLRRRLLTWLEGFKPRYDADRVLETLEKCRGTCLEPFELNEDDQFLATFLVRLGFSQRADTSSIRVVSRETIGATGGYLFSQDLTHTYLERFALSESTDPPAGTWVIAPSQEPSIGEIRECAFPDCPAKLSLNDKGMSVAFGPLDFNRLRWVSPNRRRDTEATSLDRGLDGFSRLGPSPTSGLQLRPAVSRSSVVYSTGSPESLLRFVAHLVDRPLLRVDPGPAFPGRTVLGLRLEPSEDSISLKPRAFLTSNYVGNWIQAPLPLGPRLSPKDIFEISDWAAPHESWADVIITGSTE